MDRTAAAATTTVTMAAKTVDSAVADSMTKAATTTVAAVAAKEDSACGARGTVGRTRQQSGAGYGQRVAGSLGRLRAGMRGRSRFHLPFAVARSCWSSWSREEIRTTERALSSLMLTRSPYLWAATPAAVKRSRCQVRVSVRRHRGSACGARQGQAAPQG